MPSSILNSDDGVISGTSGLKSSGGDDGVLVFQSKGTETARINTDKQIEAAAGTVSLPSITTTGDVNTGIFFSAADTLVVTTGGTAAVTVDAGQRTKFPTTIGVGGATPSTSGSGISFPATQSASSDANTLDDYEEGTWSPVSSFSGGNGTRTDVDMRGRYTKIGRCVTIVMWTQITKGTASGNLSITGLPFAMGSTATYVLGVPVASGNLTGVSGLVFGYGDTSAPATSLAMYYTGTGTTAAVTDAQMQASNSGFYSSFLYYVN
jgi:hypothetical protein